MARHEIYFYQVSDDGENLTNYIFVLYLSFCTNKGFLVNFKTIFADYHKILFDIYEMFAGCNNNWVYVIAKVSVI